jgi:pyruvate,orthophosphate dikinase
MPPHTVYFFGNGISEGDPKRPDLLGGKGAGLSEMTRIGIPVPPGFTISTEICSYYNAQKYQYPPGLEKEVMEKLGSVEEVMGGGFGDARNPLLVSIRSGAKVSMPGMMDTVLNLGLNDQTLPGLIQISGKERFAYDSYRRFIQMYSDVVLGIDVKHFERLIEEKKKNRGIESDVDLVSDDLKELVSEYKAVVKKTLGQEFPQDPYEQLWGAIGAVLRSWNSSRAVTYRKIHQLSSDGGTAVSVQAMVFGNQGNDCATGVAFTRDPSSGEKKIFGEYLINAQGEDVVAGIRTPAPIADPLVPHSLERMMPAVYFELTEIFQRLEIHYRDMQDIEFTVQRGKVWILQTRRGKRSAQAAIRIAVEMVQEGLITKEDAILRIDPKQIEQLLHPMIDPMAKKEVMAIGLAASPGGATGVVVFSPDRAEEWSEKGESVILVRMETSPEDIHGMNVASGILTARGGRTSHAAVVARGMGKCCIVGCHELHIDYKTSQMTVRDYLIKEGDTITLNGSSGEVYLGGVPTIRPKLGPEYHKLMSWVDEIRTLKVRTNADTPHDTRVAKEFGAEGIGLCRTEHMFFDLARIDAMREMILADSEKARRKALANLLPMQKGDFVEIFREMKGYPVTIRLLDPPLHEFLPHNNKDLAELSKKLDIPFSRLKRKAKSLDEFNPMLGFRGCRLGIAYPEIYQMQVQAIMEAACELVLEEKIELYPEIMVPIIGDVREFEFIRDYIVKVCDEVQDRCQVRVEYKIGTMIELPRAALTADRIAALADFFSFGTNDLTQMTFGISRDDSELFLPKYIESRIYEGDPFVSVDVEGVGRLIQIASELGRKTKADIKLGICGEHGGDPASIEFCHRSGLDYVSCSPYRVPQARLAAAQSAIKFLT